MASNALNRVCHLEESFVEAMKKVEEGVTSLAVPIRRAEDGRHQMAPVFPKPKGKEFIDFLSGISQTKEFQFCDDQKVHVGEIQEVRERLKELKNWGGVV